MKANELRIGNYVTYTDGRSVYEGTVDSVSRFKCVLHNTRLFSVKYCNIMPIPINEDVLLMFGFTLSYESSYRRKY
jgi:hypothetical protein